MATPSHGAFSDSDRGVVYIALGQRFREEATASAQSLRRCCPQLPILLFSDDAAPGGDSPFDRTVTIAADFGDRPVGTEPWSSPGWLTRIDILATFPFSRTLLLDSDTEVVGDISGVLQTLDRFDLAVAHAPFRMRRQIAAIPDSFPEFNCGVIALRRSPASQAFLQCWRKLYLEQPDCWHHDQHSFRQAAWQSEVRIATLPPEFNLRPSRHAGGNAVRILHGFRRAGRPAATDDRKIRLLSYEHGCAHHRSGWEYAQNALRGFTHPAGILLDGLLENTFVWHLSNYQRYLPIREPWIGIAHNPPAMPSGYFASAQPQNFMNSAPFLDSLPCCLGFFTLSQYHASWLRRLGKPVEVLYHPVAFDVPQFSFEQFTARKVRAVLHIGWWLRRFQSFDDLQAPGYLKCLLKLSRENALRAVEAVAWKSAVRFIDYLGSGEYDELLSRSVVFVDLMDCSASNVIIDCIARGTPLLINRHPAAQEYLGSGYPLFYDSPEMAEALLRDDGRLRAASLHMQSDAVRRRLSADAFRSAFAHSALYRGLPQC